ncbi:MAG TPA: tRNA-intron lyase [Thermoplasmata archaeon]|nr:tRNA-intron lyase [Thermoplasmata archaeon]
MSRDVSRGAFLGDHVLVLEHGDASRLRSRGRYGITVTQGALRLDLVEALHLMDEGRLRVDARREDIFSAGYRLHPDFGVRHIAYADLRGRGLVLAPAGGDRTFLSYPRGSDFGEDPEAAIRAVSERDIFSFRRTLDLVDACTSDCLAAMISVVDDEGDVTHYRVTRVDPCGDARPEIPDGAVTVLRDRGIVDDSEVAERLHEDGFFGHRMGPRTVLSLVETAYLGESGMALVSGGRRIAPAAVVRLALRTDPAAGLKIQAYRELRGRGLIPKTGFKFGGHFRVYDVMPARKRESDRTHARYLVQIVPLHFTAPWEEISRAVRLAQGVRKEMIYMSPPGRYLRLERIRP